MSEIKVKGFYVYEGRDKKTNKLLYIGTTTQVPSARFRWHKSNGKDYLFKVLYSLNNENEMLDKEFDLIRELKPPKNKIILRKQNFNKKLTEDKLKIRDGNPIWCQSCFKRRVNQGYKNCIWCGKT